MSHKKIEVEGIVVSIMHEVAPKGRKNVLRPVLDEITRYHGPIVVGASLPSPEEEGTRPQSHGPIVVGEPSRSPSKGFLENWEKTHGPIVVGSVLDTNDLRTKYASILCDRVGITNYNLEISSSTSLSQLVDVVCAKVKLE